jgi:peptidyl-tRNA hydrolase
MFIIVGLGNPGLSYRRTRHNAGFQAIDRLAERNGIRFSKKGFNAVYGEGLVSGKRCALVKPQTYMNNSGDAVQQILNYYKLSPENLIVVYDDIDLPVGSLRIRSSGSAGTHNGMRSVLACIHSENFARVRIGIGKDESLMLMDYVLKRPSKEDQKVLDETFSKASSAIEMIVDGKIAEAQAMFNKKHESSSSLSADHKE